MNRRNGRSDSVCRKVTLNCARLKTVKEVQPHGLTR